MAGVELLVRSTASVDNAASALRALGGHLTPIETALRSARILHLFFLVASGLYVSLLFWLRPMKRPIDRIFVYAIAFVCLSVIGIGLFLRKRMVAKPAARLSVNPQDAISLKQWRSGQIVSFVFAESVVLYGFVLKFLGERWDVSSIFVVAGILLLITWMPKLDVSGGRS